VHIVSPAALRHFFSSSWSSTRTQSVCFGNNCPRKRSSSDPSPQLTRKRPGSLARLPKLNTRLGRRSRHCDLPSAAIPVSRPYLAPNRCFNQASEV
jgi:hypothetical protein